MSIWYWCLRARSPHNGRHRYYGVGAGFDDEFGALDYVTREDVVRAALLIRKPRVFSVALDWEIVGSLPDLPPKNQRQVQGGKCSE